MSYPIPYCTHCGNLNRTLPNSERLKTNHYLRKTRDPSSPITCPILLKTICNKCGKYGHTRSYCIGEKVSEKPVISVKSLPNKSNRFSDLLYSDDSLSEASLSEASLSEASDSVIYETRVIFRPTSPDYPPPDYLLHDRLN
jgi:hypothetical protein